MKRVFFLVGLGIFLFLILLNNLFTVCGQTLTLPLWARSYPTEQNTWCSAVLKTDDGFIVAGNAGEAGGMSCVFLIMKLDEDGTIKWVNKYHHSPYRQATCIQEVKGEYFVAGYTFEKGNRAALVMKLDDYGVILWEKIYVSSQYHIIPVSMLDTGDGGVAIAGCIEEDQNPDNQHLLVMKLKKQKQNDYAIDWQRAYDYPYIPVGKTKQYAKETATSMVRTEAHSYLVAGNLYTPEFGYDPWIVELQSSDGSLIRHARIQGSGNNTQVTSITGISDPTSKNVYVITGFTNSKNSKGDGSFNMFAVKLKIDTTGLSMVWSLAYQNSGPDYSYSIDQMKNGDLILAGSGLTSLTNSLDALILKLDSSNGSVKSNLICYGNAYGGNDLDDGFYSVQKTTNDGFVVGGYNESFPAGGFGNIWVMSLDKNGDIDQKNDASCMQHGVDIEGYFVDWKFMCLSGFKDLGSKIEERVPGLVPKEITSICTPFELHSILLCDEFVK